ncbi:MAG TPA: DsbA family protein [Vicinamibacterales bacterium]|nr:DsbA family protein [Vicinamibacterales bacterium]
MSLSVIAACASIAWLALSVRSKLEQGPAPGKTITRRPTPPHELPRTTLPLGDAATLGDVGAKVGMVVYSDFYCPFCARFAKDTMPEIVKRYVNSGKVLLAFRHLPLEAFHPAAKKAAEFAECGRRQGQFWPIHDILFAVPSAATPLVPSMFEQVPGLNTAGFRECVGGQATAAIEREIRIAQELGVSGTPTFFLGKLNDKRELVVNRRESGAMPIEAFSAALDQLLADGSTSALK